MKPTDYDESRGRHAGAGARPGANPFRPPDYGRLEVRAGRRMARVPGAGAAGRRAARRAFGTTKYAAVGVFTAVLAVYMAGVVRHALTPARGLGPAVSRSAAERKRIAVLNPADDALEEDESESRIMREVTGLDPKRREMTDAEVASELNDPLAMLVLRKKNFPATLDELLAALDAQNGAPEGLPAQAVYLAGEGSQIQFGAANEGLNRQLRFIITRQKGNNVDLLVSVGAGGEPDGFLQVIGWDSVKNAFNYYERAGTRTWVWMGDSNHSLREGETRGEGCFQCHVNGALIMKELKLPWENWHSQSATVSASVLAPDDPLRTNRLFLQALQGGKGGQDLQKFVVEPGIRRWNVARVRKMIGADGGVRDVPRLLRQLFTTTTVNLVSSTAQRKVVTASTNMTLPLTFFVNRDALFDVLKLDPAVPLSRVSGAFFLAAESRHRLELADEEVGFVQPGDTFFPFLVPEPAHEDIAALRQMLEQKIVTPKFAACVLMIDFENPVYSKRREQLLRYAPETGRIQDGVSDVPAQFVERVTQAAASLPEDSPERQFLANWALPDDQWQAAFKGRVRAYLTAVNGKLGTDEGFDGYMRLAISRRFEFKELSAARNLAEFPLLLPRSNAAPDAPLLEMKADGGVGPR